MNKLLPIVTLAAIATDRSYNQTRDI